MKAKSKTTIVVDQDKIATARRLTNTSSASAVIDVALSRLIKQEQLLQDIAAYGKTPSTLEELALADLPVSFDLDDEDVDYDQLYGAK